MELIETLRKAGIIPVIVIEDAEQAVPLARALVKGGLPVLEVTFRTAAAADAIARIKAATSHMKGLKIGIMGCIVNGPGEMADADFGYVGAGRGKISLYKKKECIMKNIPEEEAVERLLELINNEGGE